MKGFDRDSPERPATITLLGSSGGRDWEGLHAGRWNCSAGNLGDLDFGGIQVHVLLDGSLSIDWRAGLRRRKWNAVPGTVWLPRSGAQEGRVYLHGEIREIVQLMLPAPLLSRTALREFCVDPDKVRLKYRGGFRDPLIEQVARHVRAELLNPAPAGKMLVEALALALGAHMLRHHSNLRPASVVLPRARGALDPVRLRRVKEFIETHLADELTIEVLANEVALSPFHFARAFKAATGTAPHVYLSNLRIERAKRLIAEGRLPLIEIAGLCGCSSQSYFTTWFKRNVGATPGAYRAGFARCLEAP